MLSNSAPLTAAAPACDQSSPRAARDLAVAATAQAIRTWLRLATQPAVVRRALRMAMILGTVLTIINHGDVIVRGGIDEVHMVVKMLLTFAVPYVVSTASSVAARRELEQS